jgi:3-deoxy-7-phosphoheptulonate synthase
LKILSKTYKQSGGNPMDFGLISKKKNNPTTIKIGNISIGPEELTVIAGPCSVENNSQIDETAYFLSQLGVKVLRGGAYKPRTSPYDFQGLGEDGLKYLKEAKDKFEMYSVTEVMDTRDVEKVAFYADILQVGSRNMQNFALLKEVGKSKRPVLLKRGFASTLNEWLYAAEYIASEGNLNIILCERGIRTYESYTRNTLDIAGAVAAKLNTCLPVIVDPSHGTGRKELVEPMALASIASGCNGVMIEIHPKPDTALCDGHQSLNFAEFEKVYRRIKDMYNFSASNI